MTLRTWFTYLYRPPVHNESKLNLSFVHGFRIWIPSSVLSVSCYFTGGKALFNQAPLVEVDGLNLVQSMSIVRYICNKKGWTGKTPQEKAR